MLRQKQGALIVFQKYKKRNKENYLNLGIVWIVWLSWLVGFLLNLTISPINHKRGKLCPPENGVSLVTGISTIRHHGDGGLYLDLGEIHLGKEKGRLFTEVLKIVAILDPLLVNVRLGTLEFSDGISLYLVHPLAKGHQLYHQIGVLLLQLLSPTNTRLLLAQLLPQLFNFNTN